MWDVEEGAGDVGSSRGQQQKPLGPCASAAICHFVFGRGASRKHDSGSAFGLLV